MAKRICPACGEETFECELNKTLVCRFCGTEILPPGPGVCRVCGCTDQYGCPEGCYWVEPDLCEKAASKK